MRKTLAALLSVLCLLGLGACQRNTATLGDRPAELPAPAPVTAAPAAPSDGPLRVIEPADSELVCVTDYIPDLYVELRYAGSNNFTGQTIYDFSDAWLRFGTVKKLLAVQTALRQQGLSLKIWDAFRPGSAQFTLWEVCPDARYVANPYTGRSTHSNGGTVDLTMVREDGSLLPMPTDFDSFSPLADRDYSDVPDDAAANARLLEAAMTEAGFVPYAGEFWHFADADPYPYEDLEALPFPLDRQRLFEPDGESALSLLAAPEAGAEVLARIPTGASFPVLGWAGDYARVQWQGQQGYLPLASFKEAAPGP